MERLTKPATYRIGHKYTSAIGSTNGAWPRIIQRLADYEDTGMEPDEVKQLKEFCESQTTKTLDRVYEIAKAEQEGRLFIVPAPGDVLYETDPEHGVVKHTVTDVHWVANTSAVDDNGMTWADYYTEEDIKTAHNTREAAEAVLAAGSIMEGKL